MLGITQVNFASALAHHKNSQIINAEWLIMHYEL